MFGLLLYIITYFFFLCFLCYNLHFFIIRWLFLWARCFFLCFFSFRGYNSWFSSSYLSRVIIWYYSFFLNGHIHFSFPLVSLLPLKNCHRMMKTLLFWQEQPSSLPTINIIQTNHNNYHPININILSNRHRLLPSFLMVSLFFLLLLFSMPNKTQI